MFGYLHYKQIITLQCFHLFGAKLYLARVLAALQVSSAEHGVGDHAGVGVVTVAVREDGDLQALELVTANSLRDTMRSLMD